MFSQHSTSNGRRVSVHWFAGVLQSLSAIRSAGSILSARDLRGFRGLNHLCIGKMACERALDRERGPRRPFGVVLLRHGITEQRVTELLGDVAALTTLLAERQARHSAGRAQTLQDARKPMHTDPSTI